MGIFDRFSAGWGKGFSREAGRVLEGAVELAGNYGCDRADTGHLLLAILQQDHGPAGRFLAGKNIRGTGGAPPAGRGPAGHAPAAAPAGPGPRAAPGHRLRPDRRPERPAAPGRTGTSAVRHDGGRRVHGGGDAGLDGAAAERGRAGVPPDVGTADPAGAATGGVRRAQGQPRQRQILPGPDPPCRRRGTGPRLLPGQGAGPDDRDPLPAAEE